MTRKEAEDDMVDGFNDGYDRDCPPPSGNRSRSYAHGFQNGRDDLAGSPRASAATLRQMDEIAISSDAPEQSR